MATSVGFDADAIVDRIPEPLFTSEIPLSRLDADVAEQELNLFQLTASLVAETRTRAPAMPHAAVPKLLRKRKGPITDRASSCHRVKNRSQRSAA